MWMHCDLCVSKSWFCAAQAGLQPVRRPTFLRVPAVAALYILLEVHDQSSAFVLAYIMREFLHSVRCCG